MSEGKLDIIIFGATGFTGKLCVEHILNNYKLNDANSKNQTDTFKIGLAGRNMDKLRTMLTGFDNNDKEKFELIECDSFNAEQIQSMVSRTNVIATTVGPYAVFGEKLIEICAKNGCDYIDLTGIWTQYQISTKTHKNPTNKLGEIYWVKQMIQKYEQDAIKSRARIVNVAGAECSIADIAAYSGIKQLGDSSKNYRIRTMTEAPFSFKGSGGSAQSALAAFKSDAMNGYFDKDSGYQLITSKHEYTKNQIRRSNVLPVWNAEIERYVSNIPFAGDIDRTVICRSNHLLNYMYGKAAVVDEGSIAFVSKYYLIALVLGLFYFIVPFVVIKLSFLKPIIVKFMEWTFPTSGDGQDRETMLSAIWKQYVLVEGIGGKSVKGVKAEVDIYGDYGYYNTAKILMEEAIIFALERKNGLEKDKKCGFLTPALAFGDALIERLNNLKEFDIKFSKYNV